MPNRTDLVAEALRWKGTPHKWGQSVRGRGCDCRGLIVGIGRAVGMPEAELLIVNRRNYSKCVRPAELLEGLAAALRRTRNPQPGDVLAIEIGTVAGPRHLAMLTAPDRLVHSYGGGLSAVVEVPVGRSRRIHSYWTWPSLGGQ